MLRERVALVTGASRGIGREIALHYSRHGAKLAIVGRDMRALSSLQNIVTLQTGHTPLVIEADLSSLDVIDNVSAQTLDHFGKIDILVNAAGTISRSSLRGLRIEEHLSIFSVNVHTPILLAKALIPQMAANGGGNIINITSQMARMVHPNAAVSYESSKAALAAATRHLAYHFAKDNVRVNAIAPGSIETDMLKSMDRISLDNLRSKIPLGRLGSASEVANVAVFLASEMSTYITGATIDVNGGSWMI